MSPIENLTQGYPVEADRGFYSNALVGVEGKKDPKKVAGLFEGIFYRMLFQQMRAEQEGGDPLFDSGQMRQVVQMHDDEMANKLGKMGQLGIRPVLEEHMRREMGESSPLKGLVKGPKFSSRVGG